MEGPKSGFDFGPGGDVVAYIVDEGGVGDAAGVCPVDLLAWVFLEVCVDLGCGEGGLPLARFLDGRHCSGRIVCSRTKYLKLTALDNLNHH